MTFLNLLSKLTGGNKDQGLAFNEAIVELLHSTRPNRHDAKLQKIFIE
jgi:hypothetical protein